MGKMAMILINGLLLSVVTAFMDMRFDYQIIEGKARYLENIETNLEKNIVKIHTPAHNDVMESFLIQDFIQGRQLKCLPRLKQCRLRDIDRETAIDAGRVTEAFIHSWNKGDNAITSENEVVMTEMYYADFDEVIDYNSLGQALKEFYQDFKYPLYKEKKIPQDAIVFNMTDVTGNRFKRSYQITAVDCNGEAPITVFGISSGKGCHHLKMCKESAEIDDKWVLTDCSNAHIQSPLTFKCLCCEWAESFYVEGGDNCKCERMQDWLR